MEITRNLLIDNCYEVGRFSLMIFYREGLKGRAAYDTSNNRLILTINAWKDRPTPGVIKENLTEVEEYNQVMSEYGLYDLKLYHE